MVRARMRVIRLSRPLATACCTLVVMVAAAMAAFPGTSAQVSLPTGQNIAPAYEGWEENSDGSFNLVFGYFNRNWDEEIDLPIGPDNTSSRAEPIKDSRPTFSRGAIASSSGFASPRISASRSWCGRSPVTGRPRRRSRH